MLLVSTCTNCKAESPLISGFLGLCADCIRADFDRVLPRIRDAHRRSREGHGLPAAPPRGSNGVRCGLWQSSSPVGPHTACPALARGAVSRRRRGNGGSQTAGQEASPLPTGLQVDGLEAVEVRAEQTDQISPRLNRTSCIADSHHYTLVHYLIAQILQALEAGPAFEHLAVPEVSS